MDNAPAHTAKKTQELMRTWGIKTVKWPANSPDLNPIEGVWALLKQRIHDRRPRPTDAKSIRKALEEEWARLKPEDYRKIIDSMPNRIEAVIQANGGHIRW